ncbi:PepSY-associated TM helix domain-containing protein [Thalassotalea sp. 1_MG-2023]|uniref:PepSY-associated TM helix domain-containing protein n=1 Tax=Thalassotalea sp. 1_MG-2023 TaxID=3062680 RepID=UPI0026E47C75|nr:PepSY-associated TM helix domain-containing protein [Thalassotalea sp. 1_MG-2023]MDO6428600.1 PepSY-associated TM helix domain-containing protein [Thalassotalea sp. 1_MG-2023]
MQVSFGSIRQWHWVSSALCLIGMLGFAITGITLNHAADITVTPQITTLETKLPDNLLKKLRAIANENPTSTPPKALSFWLAQTHSLHLSNKAVAEWSEDELYIVHAGPGKDTWLAVDFYSNELSYESTERGLIAYFNDLHKGRDTGIAWGWFIDAFSVACVVFCFTGLLLLYRQKNHRWMTWPVTVLGAIIPTILLLLFVH